MSTDDREKRDTVMSLDILVQQVNAATNVFWVRGVAAIIKMSHL